MHLFRSCAVVAALVVVSSSAHADFFDVVKKVGQVADAAEQVQAVAEGRAEPKAALKGLGDSKHGSSHGGKHHK